MCTLLPRCSQDGDTTPTSRNKAFHTCRYEELGVLVVRPNQDVDTSRLDIGQGFQEMAYPQLFEASYDI